MEKIRFRDFTSTTKKSIRTLGFLTVISTLFFTLCVLFLVGSLDEGNMFWTLWFGFWAIVNAYNTYDSLNTLITIVEREWDRLTLKNFQEVLARFENKLNAN